MSFAESERARRGFLSMASREARRQGGSAADSEKEAAEKHGKNRKGCLLTRFNVLKCP
jgi:hypothetical protein